MCQTLHLIKNLINETKVRVREREKMFVNLLVDTMCCGHDKVTVNKGSSALMLGNLYVDLEERERKVIKWPLPFEEIAFESRKYIYNLIYILVMDIR